MIEISKILFPIDFSECSERVFPDALDMAQKFDARLHLLFVARDLVYLASIDVASDVLMNTSAEIARTGERQMEAFCEKHLGDFSNYDTKVVIGNPEEEILKFANEQGMDLIVIGTHGRKGLERTLMGSVAERVVKNASVPVLTINPFRPACRTGRSRVKYVHT